MSNNSWYTVSMKLKMKLDTEHAFLLEMQGVRKFKGWVFWLPKGCVKDRRTIVLHKSMTLTLFVPTKSKQEERQEHEVTAEEFYNLYNKGGSND